MAGNVNSSRQAHVIESVILTFYIRAAIPNSTILKAVTMPVLGVFFKSIIDRSDKIEPVYVSYMDLHQVHLTDIVKFQRGFDLVKMIPNVALFCISQ